MRKIIVQEMMSVDGFFAGANGEIDWFVWDNTLKDLSINTLGSTGTLLFGRVTYEMMAGYWPTAKEDDPVIVKAMNSLPKIVFSRSLKQAGWNNTQLVKEMIPEEILKMKQQQGKDIVIYGSGTLVSSLAQKGLIDEYRFIVNPVVLGSGKSLFRGFTGKLNLNLLGATPLGSGNVLLKYQPSAGTGT